MKIKNIVFASLFLGASLLGTSAFAATVGKTVNVNLASDGDGGFNAHFGNNFSSADTSNLFTDKYMFVLANNYDSAASVTSSYLKSSTVKDLQITGFSLVQYDPLTSAILHTYGGTNTTAGGLNPTDNWEFHINSLSVGSYFIEVDGSVLGSGGGSYGSDLTVSIAAVPEPETYGMMAAGLALMGLVARRKKAKKA